MKTYKIVILSIIFLVLCIISFLYLVFRTKKKDVTNVSPYIEIINEKLILERDLLLIKNIGYAIYEKEYLIVEKDAVLDEEIIEKNLLKAGTSLTVKQAKLYTNSVSGYTQSMILGTIATDFGEIEFEHDWGDENLNFYLENPDFFTFKKPIWETNTVYTDKKFYLDHK